MSFHSRLKSFFQFRFSEFGEGMLKSEVEPVVKKSLKINKNGPKGSSLPSVDFQFTKTDFGTIPPKISNIQRQSQ